MKKYLVVILRIKHYKDHSIATLSDSSISNTQNAIKIKSSYDINKNWNSKLKCNKRLAEYQAQMQNMY